MNHNSTGYLKDVRVLVTGGGGFIGSNLVRRLLKEGAEVYVFDISKSKNIEDVLEYISFYNVDISDFSSVNKVINEILPEKIYHLGGFADPKRSFLDIERIIRINIQGTINLINAMNGKDYDCFIHVGTLEEYGNNPVPFTEKQIPDPMSPYSASKTSAAVFCKMFHKVFGSPTITLRLPVVYGQYQSPKMFIPELIISALLKKDFKMSEGEQSRNFIYVEDIVDGLIKASIKKEAIGEIINLGNEKEYKLKDVVTKVLDLMGNPIKPLIGALPYRNKEIMHYYCDGAKARDILGWYPKIDLDTGLKKTIDWYAKNYKNLIK